MIFDNILTAITLGTSILSIIILKFTLPDIVKYYPITQIKQNSQLSYMKTLTFLLKRLTLIEIFLVRKSLYKISHLFSFAIILLLSCLIPSTKYWGWAIGTLISTGIYLIVELTMEIKDSSHQNTFWKRTLIYSIMTTSVFSCCLVSLSIARFHNIMIIDFVKSLVISIGIDEIFGKPIVIMLFSLILQDSQKMKRLKTRFQLIQANKIQVASAQQASQQVIAINDQVKIIYERNPLQEITNNQRKLTLPTCSKNQKINQQIISDEVDTRRSVKIRSKLKLSPVLSQININLQKCNSRLSQNQNIIFSNADTQRVTESKQQLIDKFSQLKKKRKIKRQKRYSNNIKTEQQKQMLDDLNCTNLKQKDNEVINNKIGFENNKQNNEQGVKNESEKNQKQNKLEFCFSDQIEQQKIQTFKNDENNNNNKEQKENDQIQQYKQQQKEFLKQQQLKQELDLTYNDNQFIAKSNIQHFDSLMKVLNNDQSNKLLNPLKSNSYIKTQFFQQGSTTLQDIGKINSRALLSHTQSVIGVNNRVIDNLASLNIIEVQKQVTKLEKTESQGGDIEVLKCSMYSKISKKLNLCLESVEDDIQQYQAFKYIENNESPQKKQKNKSINLSKHLSVIDADQQQFVEEFTPKKNRSNSQDPSRPIKIQRTFFHNNSQASGLKKSILEIKEMNSQTQDLQQITLAPVSVLKQKKQQSKKIHKRKNYKMLFKGDSPYLQYLPNMLNKQIKNQFSDRKQKQNFQVYYTGHTRNLATINHTQNIRPFQ